MMAASMDLEVLAKTQGLQLEKQPGMTLNPCQVRPESRGHIHIKSPDATVYPSILPNYMSDPLDQEADRRQPEAVPQDHDPAGR